MGIKPIKPIIFNAEPAGYAARAREVLSSFACLKEEALERPQLLKAISAVDGLIVRLGHRVDEELLQAAPKLRFVATATTGLNHIDLNAAARRGIAILSLRGETAFLDSVTSTAEHTWGLLLALIRHLPEATEHVRNGGWDRGLFKGRELSGLTLGIIGYGRLGRMVAAYGRAFRMRVLAADPNPISKDDNISFVSMPELLAASDIVSVHVALCEKTQKLLDKPAFDMMKRGAYLINTARGELLDEQALLNALSSGKLAGAALDVISDEASTGQRLPSTHPLREYAKKSGRLLITPHIGGATSDASEKTEIFIAQKIKTFLRAGKF